MTCIAAVRDGKRVWIGGDSAVTDSSSALYDVVLKSKVFRLGDGEYLAGVAGDLAVVQAIRYKLVTPLAPKDCSEPLGFVVKDFLPRLHTALDLIAEPDFDLILTFGGHLFSVSSSFAVLQHDDYATAGAGAQVALGALASTPHLSPLDRVRNALRIAAKHVEGVREPFDVLCDPE